MTSRTFTTQIVRDGPITVPFDPRPVFGKLRAPVKVTLNGYSFTSTIFSMGGERLIPLRKSHREAAGLEGGETVEVTLELDAQERRVEPPPDLVAALKSTVAGWARWQELSFTHQREYAQAVEEAKKPETRARRIASAVEKIAARPAKKKG